MRTAWTLRVAAVVLVTGCTIPALQRRDSGTDVVAADAPVEIAMDVAVDDPEPDTGHFVLDCEAGADAGRCPCGQLVCDTRCTNILGDPLNCGDCGHICERAHARASCIEGDCQFVCAPGYHRVRDTCVPTGAARLIAPLSTARTTTRRPRLRWLLADGSDGVFLQICSTRECSETSIEVARAVTGSEFTPEADLATGVHFWRVFDGARFPGSGVSATWQFDAPRRNAPVNSSWGTRPDFDGDGHTDLGVGAPQSDGMSGAAYLFRGTSDGIDVETAWRSYVREFPQDLGWIGTPVESGGDLDGDGFAELWIGAPYPLVGTRAYLFYGSHDGPGAIADVRLLGRGPDGFGGSIAGAGDLNGDGYGDAVITSTTTGGATVYYGSETGLDVSTSVLLSATGRSNVAQGGDVNGDGYADLVISTKSAFGQGGYADFRYGGPRGVSRTASFRLAPGTAPDRQIDGDVSGDFDGDGYADLVLSLVSTATMPGQVFVYPGSANGLAPAGTMPVPSLTITAPVAGVSGFGTNVGATGDFNGDGYDDLVVGSPEAQPNDVGAAYLYLGGPGGLQATPTTTLTGSDTGPSTHLGGWMSRAGDIDGDGFDDVFIGGYQARREGRVFVFFGAAGVGLSQSRVIEISNPMTGYTEFGLRIAELLRRPRQSLPSG